MVYFINMFTCKFITLYKSIKTQEGNIYKNIGSFKIIYEVTEEIR